MLRSPASVLSVVRTWLARTCVIARVVTKWPLTVVCVKILMNALMVVYVNNVVRICSEAICVCVMMDTQALVTDASVSVKIFFRVHYEIIDMSPVSLEE